QIGCEKGVETLQRLQGSRSLSVPRSLTRLEYNMTSIQQPLPQFAPLTAVMKRDPSNPQFAGMVGGAKDGFFGNGETPWFLTTSIGSGPDATQKQSLAYWKQDGIDFVDSTGEPLTKGEAARTALAQVAQAVQQLGSPVAIVAGCPDHSIRSETEAHPSPRPICHFAQIGYDCATPPSPRTIHGVIGYASIAQIQ
ncbi:MAG TPA: hypothetical protein PL105_23730, partial [Caldilineaceae bacterium]|nr:hypothetical protein [Caldilineaceae bacterium]